MKIIIRGNERLSNEEVIKAIVKQHSGTHIGSDYESFTYQKNGSCLVKVYDSSTVDNSHWYIIRVEKVGGICLRVTLAMPVPNN